MIIKFYKSKEPHGFLNNYYPSRIFIYDNWWNHVEGPYQSCKVLANDPVQKEFALLKSPKAARDLGQTVNLRPDWDLIKDEVMRQCLMAKFTQNRDLLKQLFDTEDAEIIENSPIDSYWGCGADGNGQNKLGKLLVSVREFLKINY